jgi:hypothetical protein
MTARMFGPISAGRNRGYLTDKVTILNCFLLFKLSKVNCVCVLHLPRYFPPTKRCLHITVSHRLRLQGPMDGTSFSPRFVNNGHFIKNYKGRISYVVNACYSPSPYVSLCTPNFKIKRLCVR